MKAELQRDRIRAIRLHLESCLLRAMERGNERVVEVIEIALWPDGGLGLD